MLKTLLYKLKEHLGFERANIVPDLIAALTVAIQRIPDSMATALLAGINPLIGLYTMMVATPVGALFSSSVMMHISNTSAISLAIGGALIEVPENQKLNAVFILALLVGVIQIALGLFRMGFLVRFVPFSVMTGFMNGVALLIILGQLADLTGFKSAYSNSVLRAVDTVTSPASIVIPTLIVGLATIGLILLFERIKVLSRYSLVLGMILASVLTAFPPFHNVLVVGDITSIPNALPEFSIPTLYHFFELILPAFAIAIIGLVQGAGIGQLYPNPNGKFPDASGDFIGQGAANVAAGFYGGMPNGGSVSGTALIIGSGGKSRLANIMVGVLIAVIVLVFAGTVKLIAMPALAGLLIVIGFQTLKPANMKMVWHTSQMSRVVMIITFLGTLVMPLQYAVFLGVSISILLQLGRQADNVKLVEFIRGDGDLPFEREPPKHLSDSTITILHIYGSLFYAAAKNLEEVLPEVGEARRPVVIFLLRGHDELGSTMMSVFERYARAVQTNDGMIMFAGISEHIREQMERTGLLRLVGPQNAFLAEKQWGVAAYNAIAKAEEWLASQNTEQTEDQDPG